MKRKTTGIVAILLIASMTLWAADTSELRGKFTDSLANGNLEEAISNYDEMVSQAGKDYQKAQRSYEKALEAGNKPKAMEAWRDMHSSYYMAMTRDETDDMLALILAEDEDARIEDAKWLEANSRYYSPSITYEWSSSGDNYSFSYSSTSSVIPGESIILPDKDDIRVSSAAGILSGWGITPDEVTYQPGETIAAPLTDQTLYAIWTTEVVFKDSVTGMESTINDVADGDLIDVPALTEEDDSFVFAGWVDRSTGEYIAPDETEFELEGNGAVFEALWKNAELSDLEAKHYAIDSLPVNTQVDLTFVIANNGTENLKNVKIECTGDESLSVLSGNGSVRMVGAGDSVTLTGLRVVGTEAGEHMLHISATDRDGDSWSTDFTVTVV
ncbi:MAG: hypothetical protein IAA97_02015 [Spirochaetes bacterium]|uniref:Uncharacterized protein n=1 Tax=Candidatus Ornithospirochaeta stercoripullorum TaxID=2840899 RepID=A0A9D9H449_9SPIO|nr:hypothetical protein [Candidatus Ornithospirochaeta stercoripullorum]